MRIAADLSRSALRLWRKLFTNTWILAAATFLCCVWNMWEWGLASIHFWFNKKKISFFLLCLEGYTLNQPDRALGPSSVCTSSKPPGWHEQLSSRYASPRDGSRGMKGMRSRPAKNNYRHGMEWERLPTNPNLFTAQYMIFRSCVKPSRLEWC